MRALYFVGVVVGVVGCSSGGRTTTNGTTGATTASTTAGTTGTTTGTTTGGTGTTGTTTGTTTGGTTGTTGGTGTPTATHPRIWMVPGSTLQKRVLANAEANTAQWQSLKQFCEFTTPDDGGEYEGSGASDIVIAYSLCYRVAMANPTLKTPFASPAPVYAARAISALTTIDSTTGSSSGTANANSILSFTAYQTDDGYGMRNYMPALAIAYDWLYDYAGLAAIKTQIINQLENWVTWYTTGKVNGTKVGTNYCYYNSPTDYDGVGDTEQLPLFSNYYAGYVKGIVLGAIAVYGDDPDGDALWTKATYAFNTPLAYYDAYMPGGHWPEGWEYGTGVLTDFYMASSALVSATGDMDYARSAWMANNILFKLNLTTPDGKFMYDDGQWSAYMYGGVPDVSDLIVGGALYGWSSSAGQIVQTAANLLTAGGGSPTLNDSSPSSSYSFWPTFLFYDPAASAAPLTMTNKSYYAAGSGVVAMRSDWSAPTGTWGSFHSGPYLDYEGEEAYDAGHVEIYKSSNLLVDAGQNLSGLIVINNTSSKNSFTLEGLSSAYQWDGQTTSDWPGVVDSLPGPSGCPNPTGHDPIGINGYLDTGAYVYTTGEYSAAYQSKPGAATCGTPGVNWLQRSVFYVRPDVFVYYDQIQKAAALNTVVPTMHFHFPKAPTQQSGNNFSLSMDNAGGRLQMVIVLPSPTAATANVTNDAVNMSTGPGVANYHLQVAYTSTASQYQSFLTVMRAGLSTATYTFPAVTAINGTNAYGADIRGLSASAGESTTPTVVVFADNGLLTAPSSLSYSHTAATGTVHYIVGLAASTSYYVTKSAGTISLATTGSGSALMSNGSGILQLTE